MSNASPILNGENTGGVVDFSTDASVNMVAAIHDHISCAKPVQVNPFDAQDNKTGVLAYSCEFDHMYASLTEGTTVQKDGAEVKHLKELLLLHLDLIQQQSEQLVTKDKQLSALRQENETLRQRLERMDRRVTLQKHREVSEIFVPSSGGCISPPTASPPFATGGPSLLIGSSGTSIIECDTETITIPLDTIDSTIHNVAVVNNSETSPIKDNQNIVGSPRSSWEIAKRRRRGDTENTNTAGGSDGRRKRLASWTSVNSDVLSHDGRNSVTKETGEHKRMQKRLRTKGGPTKKDSVLTTNTLYYTPVGESELPWGTEECKLSGHVEVPSWRIRVYTSCYTMEGTENLDDEVFNKRHQRLEIDERRRKRWDVQRIREQRQVERLKQREMASARRGSAGGSSSHLSDGEEPLSSLWPQLDDAEFLEVSECVPVAAFGLPITKFTASEFSLPWLTSARCKTPSQSSSRRRENKR
ncbi:male-specific lethal 1 homolog [Periplaneta americana]|uniref:male-specific lethal 1 homolog n=1 Tax=Periplaneta americana TaxID=6978 RepID=UPI0037E8F3B8